MSHSDTHSHTINIGNLTIGAALACCLGLTGCMGLMTKQIPGQPAAEASPPASARASSIATTSAKPRSGAYVDPMVSLKPRSARSATPNTQAEQARTVAGPQSTEALAQTQSPQNSLANVIQQPTAVQAGNNSIFAIANAKVAESQGVPAYAPVRNINPMAGSVFSARTGTATNAMPPSNADNKNGLW